MTDLAEHWNSCVRFSCLKHGITLHTNFDMVPPFPRFFPTVQMKREGYVVLNAGNFIHVLSINLENIERKKENDGETVVERTSRLNSGPRITAEDSDEEIEGVALRRNRSRFVNFGAGVASKRPCIAESSGSETEAEVGEGTEVVDEYRVSFSNFNGRNDTDRDREWEILIGNIPGSEPCSSQEDSRTRQTSGDSKKETITTRSWTRSNRSKLRGEFRSSDSEENRDEAWTDDDGNEKTRIILPDYLLMDDPSSRLGSLADSFDEESDDSTRCYLANRDKLFNELRDGGKVSNNSSDSKTKVICDETKFKYSKVLRSGTRLMTRSSTERSFVIESPEKQADKEYEFIDEITESGHEKLSVFRRRRLADKKYEFSDENSENVPQNYRSFRNQSRNIILSPSRSPRVRSISVPFSELSVDLGEPSGLLRSVYEKLLSPSSGGGSPNDVLRPINQNITSPTILSPQEDRWKEEIDRLEKVCTLDVLKNIRLIGNERLLLLPGVLFVIHQAISWGHSN